jgi:hypothetical protein
MPNLRPDLGLVHLGLGPDQGSELDYGNPNSAVWGSVTVPSIDRISQVLMISVVLLWEGNTLYLKVRDAPWAPAPDAGEESEH